MDLRNLEITLGELLKNQAAKAILMREFPSLTNSPLVMLYSKKSIRHIIDKSKGMVSKDKLNCIISELERI